MNLGMHEKSIKLLNPEQLEFLRNISQQEKQQEVKLLKAIYTSPNGVSVYHAFDIDKRASDIKLKQLLGSIMEDSNWTLYEERDDLFYQIKKRDI